MGTEMYQCIGLHVKCTCIYIFVLNVQLLLHVKRRRVL